MCWVGRAAALCLDGTSCVVCVGVGECAGLAGQPNGAWMLVAVLGGGPPPPGRPSECVGRGPTQCALEGPSPVSFENVHRKTM